MANTEKIGHPIKFRRNIQLNWQGLEMEDFCDMTLAGDENEFKVHKTIIASSSSVLKNILKLNTNPNPLIYLSGVNYENLESLVMFMYQGEVNVNHNALETFLEIAEHLGLKGLSENKTSDKDGKLSPKRQNNQKKGNNKIENIVSTPSPKSQQIEFEEKEINCKMNNENTNVIVSEEEPKLKDENDLDFKVDDSENVLEPKIEIEIAEETNSKEKTFCCDECNRKFTYKRSLQAHKLALHGGEQFLCDQCDHQSTTKTRLKLHLSSVHAGLRFSCGQCEYQATTTGNLKVHVQKHEGVRYPCDKCEFQATEKIGLKKHKQIVHEGVRYPCSQCSFQATQKRYLHKHIEKQHNPKS